MWEYLATVVKWTDADSGTFLCDLGFFVQIRQTFRLAGLDAPEMSTPIGRAVKEMMEEQAPAGSQVRVVTRKDAGDKYGRYLCEVFLPDEEISLNQRLIEAGLAKPYEGGKREKEVIP